MQRMFARLNTHNIDVGNDSERLNDLHNDIDFFSVSHPTFEFWASQKKSLKKIYLSFEEGSICIHKYKSFYCLSLWTLHWTGKLGKKM